MRSLGIIVYPDGSQAEIIAVRYSDTNHCTIRIEPLAKPRQLTYAPFGVLVSLLCLIAFSLSSCRSLPIKGDKSICLLDYKSGVKLCEYDTWEDCHADLRKGTMCYRR